jgi:DNA-binding IclR family transcriptional regulator
MFEAFAECGQPMSLSQLARLLEIPTSTCFGLLRTLLASGYLYEIGDRKTYYPTSKWLEKAREIAAKDPIQDQLGPYLAKLRDLTGETVVLGKRLSDCVVYLSVLDSLHAVRYNAKVGDLKPLYLTSSGKALLSAIPDAERPAVLSKLNGLNGVRLAPSHRSQLIEELRQSAKRGWFLGRGESVIDVMGVAAPVYVAGDVLSVAVTGPMNRMEPKLHAHAKQLVWTCQALLKR